MSSVELFAQAQQLRQAAEDLRTRARNLAIAVDDVQQAPGDATNSLGHETWVGTKATSSELLMHDAYDILGYAAALTVTDVEDLEYQARQLSNQAEQIESQARQAGFAEAQARTEAQAAQRAASSAATSTPAPAPATPQLASSQPASVPPVLVYAPIETVPVEPVAAATQPTVTTNEDADFLY
jgi:hypothetical protein